MTDADAAVGSVLLEGFYGRGNAGDEAILAALVQQIRASEPSARIVAASDDPAYTRTRHDVDDSVPRYRPKDGTPPGAWLAALREADHLWIGGGGLFGERKMLKYAAQTAVARTLGTRVATVGVGSGPFEGRNRLARATLAHADAVTVRDELSARALREAGVRREVDVLADPVFGYDLDPDAVALPPALDRLLENEVLAVSVREPSSASLDVDGLGRALSTAATELGAELLFLPFHVRRGAEPSDAAVAQRVAATVGDVESTVWTDELGFRELFGAIDRARALVGMRLHSVIFAAVVGTPFVGVPYAPKCVSHLRRLGVRADLDCERIDADRLAAAVRSRWERGTDPGTDAAVDAYASRARAIVPSVRSRSSACSPVRTPGLVAQVGLEGAARIASGVRH